MGRPSEHGGRRGASRPLPDRTPRPPAPWVDRPPPPPAPPEARQRWRLVLAREPIPPDGPQREANDRIDAAIRASGLPIASGGRARSGIAFGAPLPVAVPAEADLVDVLLTERRAAAEIRERLTTVLPPEVRLVDLYDVWTGEPPLPGQVAAAEYRVTLEPEPAVAPAALEAAAEHLLRADSLPRDRPKGSGTVRYDLRPLLLAVEVEAGPPVVLRLRTRFHPELGSGRPAEVLAALAERIGSPILSRETVRERLLLADEVLGQGR